MTLTMLCFCERKSISKNASKQASNQQKYFSMNTNYCFHSGYSWMAQSSGAPDQFSALATDNLFNWHIILFFMWKIQKTLFVQNTTKRLILNGFRTSKNNIFHKKIIFASNFNRKKNFHVLQNHYNSNVLAIIFHLDHIFPHKYVVLSQKTTKSLIFIQKIVFMIETYEHSIFSSEFYNQLLLQCKCLMPW